MDYKSQAVQDVSVRIHSINEDGTDNTGDAANLSTVIIDPAGNELIGTTNYTEATFDEIGTTGIYECLFSLIAPVKVFTLIDQDNPYSVILVTSTADAGSSGKDVKIVSKLIGELASQVDVTDIKDVSLGKWVIDHEANTLTLYRVDGITVLKVFDLTSSSDIIPAYIERTPQ